VEDQLSIPSHFKEKAIALHLKKIHSTAWLWGSALLTAPPTYLTDKVESIKQQESHQAVCRRAIPSDSFDSQIALVFTCPEVTLVTLTLEAKRWELTHSAVFVLERRKLVFTRTVIILTEASVLEGFVIVADAVCL
jgi:hypothetical protein